MIDSSRICFDKSSIENILNLLLSEKVRSSGRICVDMAGRLINVSWTSLNRRGKELRKDKSPQPSGSLSKFLGLGKDIFRGLVSNIISLLKFDVDIKSKGDCIYLISKPEVALALKMLITDEVKKSIQSYGIGLTILKNGISLDISGMWIPVLSGKNVTFSEIMKLNSITVGPNNEEFLIINFNVKTEKH